MLSQWVELGPDGASSVRVIADDACPSVLFDGTATPMAVRSAPDQKIEKAYDTSYRVTSEKISLDTDYCTERKGLEIKADLERHLVGDYTPNLPKPKPVASCGFWGCQSSGDQAFSDKKFWDDQQKNNPKK